MLWFALFAAIFGMAQSTEGLITGRVFDRLTNAGIADAVIEYEQLATSTKGVTTSGLDGNYYIPLLPPGSYRVRANGPANRYQALEIYGVSISVAGYVGLDFDLRPIGDVWERGRYGSVVFRNNSVLPFFGPDVDPSYVGTFEPQRRVQGQLEPSISEVIDPKAIQTLPLIGRDIYTALVLQAGVTADSATTRSLGLSANGQRPSSSNFLLDGVEENDSLLSGPALQLAPEMVQEYRVSTNNFSAEYGRTSGYIANAVTRSGAATWHGIVYGDLNNQVLNANTFQNNLSGLPRNTLHQIESGVSIGGTIPHSRLRVWTAVDRFGDRSFSNPAAYVLPTKTFADSLPKNSVASQLLQLYPPAQWANSSSGVEGRVDLSTPVTLRRTTVLERSDYSFSSKQNLMARYAGEWLNRPDFNWSPYGQAPYWQKGSGGTVALTSIWSPAVVTEVRASFLDISSGWNLALANLPAIQGLGNLDLPGNCCEVNRIDQGWRDHTDTTELSGSLNFSKEAHLLKVGAGLLDIRPQTAFSSPPVTSFTFLNIAAFATDSPGAYDATLSRFGLQQGNYFAPNTSRLYRSDQLYIFAQEDWRVSQRLTINAGVRYDRFPAPVNHGATPDVLVTPGPGTNFDAQISSAVVQQHTGPLFSTYPNNWSVRVAFSLVLNRKLGTVLRSGYGTFYDRPFENLFLTATANDLSPKVFFPATCPVQTFYASRNYSTLPDCSPYSGSATNFELTMFQNKLHSPRVHSFFSSLQQPLGRSVALEVNGVASLGRNLLATDVINRPQGILPPSNGLPEIDYRTNQGNSDYSALSTSVRYQSNRITLNAAYTWSHSIDNQSDPLLGEYFDFGFSNQTDRSGQGYVGAFTLQGNPRIDRGNSDFDQRQNLVGWSSIALPGPTEHRLKPWLSNWSSGIVFGVRSGLPYSVYAGVTNCLPVCNTRANLVNPSAATYLSVPGGIQLLNPAAFSVPDDGTNGNSGRNAFRGPGFLSLDLSIDRSFPIRRLGEQARLHIRADAFNLINHANLQNPEAYLGETGFLNPEFGIGLYGVSGRNSGFPSTTPLIEIPRQIHLLVRFEF